jgi:hypothetical protein
MLYVRKNTNDIVINIVAIITSKLSKKIYFANILQKSKLTSINGILCFKMRYLMSLSVPNSFEGGAFFVKEPVVW